MSFANEFAVADLIMKSHLPTSGVDAFALSIIKMERQMRKLFTYLVYQAQAFGPEHAEELKQVLGASRKAYFVGFERGINDLSRISIEEMVGQQYAELRPILSDALDVRNKVFHGQVTMRCLQRETFFGVNAVGHAHFNDERATFRHATKSGRRPPMGASA
ncbi:hypothetical protein [Paraburkholderia xenovorans]|uniref:hypothetical protein n=1 Tax=Paraburkholderia xenovorans TaxID=36873 RepID=UPI0015C526D4|nr:hypothetical protein [Paraburkholderia xenovorans]NPT34232.1 hypothetical protein [Paraburkholderia xenovorans]